MSDFERIAATVTGPAPGTATATDTRPPQRIADTGTTEDTVGFALLTGADATILVGAVAVRFRLASATGLSNQVATTDPIIPAYGRYDWFVEANTCCPYMEAADGLAAYEGWAYTSSPRV